MDSLPYVDTLFKEYLLFRGFTATLQSFSAELEADRCCGFQAEALCELIFGQLLPQCRTSQLMEVLELLADRLYSQLDGRFEAVVERMEVALMKAALVTSVKAGRQDKEGGGEAARKSGLVAEFFRQHGDALLSGPEAGVWRQWAALAFVPNPRKDPAFQAYFSPDWMSLLEVDSLLRQVESLSQQLEAAKASMAAAVAASVRHSCGDGGLEKEPREERAAVAAAAVVQSPPLAAAGGCATAGAVAGSKDTHVGGRTPVMQLPGGGDGSGDGSANDDGGGGGAGAARPTLQLQQPAAVSIKDDAGGLTDKAAAADLTPSLPSPLPPPPPQRPPSPSTTLQQRQQQQQPLSPSHHQQQPQHHCRTLSLEVSTAYTGYIGCWCQAWHAMVDSSAAAVPPQVEVAASVQRYGTASGRSAGGGGSGGTTGAAFSGFASSGRPNSEAGDVDGAGGGGDVSQCDAVALAPSPEVAAPSSYVQRSAGAALPSLAEEPGDAAPAPLIGSASSPLSSSVAAAAGAIAVLTAAAPDLRSPHGNPLRGGDGNNADGDADVDMEEDPAVMLVSGPAVMEASGGGVRRRRTSSRSSSNFSGGDRSMDEDEDEDDIGTAVVPGVDDEEDNAEVGMEAEGGRQHEGADVTHGRMEDGDRGYGSAPSTESTSSGGGGGGGGTAVVGGGRWLGVSTHLAPPGTLHGRGSAVLAAQFSPGGGHNLVTGAADGSVAIWSPLSVMLVGTAGRGILAWHADTRRAASEMPPDPTAPWAGGGVASYCDRRWRGGRCCRANMTCATLSAPAVSTPAAVQVYDSAAETVLVTCCGATLRLWSLRRLAEPLLSVPLLPYLPYGGGGGAGWSPDWSPCMCLSPRGAAAAVVLGGGGPAVYLIDLQGDGADEAAAAGGGTVSAGAGGGGGGGVGSGSSTWLSSVFGSPSTASGMNVPSAALNRMAAAAVGRVSVILPYDGSDAGISDVGGLSGEVGGGSGMPCNEFGVGGGGGGRDGGGGCDVDGVYGTSCSWHPTRDVLVVGYRDGASSCTALSHITAMSRGAGTYPPFMGGGSSGGGDEGAQAGLPPPPPPPPRTTGATAAAPTRSGTSREVTYDGGEHWEEGETGEGEWGEEGPSRMWGSGSCDTGTQQLSSDSPVGLRTPRSNRLSRQRRQLTTAAGTTMSAEAAAGGGGGGEGGGGGLGSGGAFSPVKQGGGVIMSPGGGIASGILNLPYVRGGADAPYAPPAGVADAVGVGGGGAGRVAGGISGCAGGGSVRHSSGEIVDDVTAGLPPNVILDEQAEMARHPFPIPPHELIARARRIFALGVAHWRNLSDDFEFTAPFIGPLGPDEFRTTMSTLALEEAFSDMEPRYHHFRVDPFRPNRVWVTLQPRCTHTGTFRGKLPFGIPPTGKVIEEPPQTASITFNAAGEVEAYTMGYVMDRRIGNTDGLGGAFGLMWALGAPLPAPEGRPWSPSLQLRLVNSGNWLLQLANTSVAEHHVNGRRTGFVEMCAVCGADRTLSTS
ncbi:hypothetical protein VOLCADRAFT_94556 [Volvox carteri f. nagariensis]|uniref:ARMC9 CTLH-like domain-containing protein n=1 Tax=Volvox carteri f. nagariensis TaxID=3068 RepID=D8U537_VOLCA|nr:uncharacterized protein VOLCADRAFT_94556 [Volvox carteri f. nagariensis]EFJ45079.1 hypothetical protein VOLCADRAFT_94556 [Volvox carteri f. nagariensis]|eukprot:XP_002953755.1 hypothetical protein VOLCADRAFT_94556 [Volvox carteri f. nagariensis]